MPTLTLTESLPAFHLRPTGPMWRLLRQMSDAPLVTMAVRPGKVACHLGGCPVDSRLLAGLIARDLVEERPTGDGRSEYHLTAEGRRWAETTPEATS